MLVEHFVAHYSSEHRLPPTEIAPDAMQALLAYRWPGNVRELKNVIERVVLRTGGRAIARSDLPSEFGAVARRDEPAGVAGQAATSSSVADELAAQMLRHGQSFWSVAYPLFMSRDLTRADLRRVVQIGLEQTNGNYLLLVQLFNMPSEDYKKFLGFLRKHDCHLPFQRFRSAPARQPASRERLTV